MLLATVAFAGALTAFHPAAGQDVVMRRPLPFDSTGASTPTPVPTATPTPVPTSTPTPTPVPTPTPSPSPTPVVSIPTDTDKPCDTSDSKASCYAPGTIQPEPYPGTTPSLVYGWEVDCVKKTITCMRRSGSGWWNSFEPVSASDCPSSQPADANGFAHGSLYFGMGEGVDATHGLEMCNGTTPPPTTKYYDVGSMYCSASTDVYMASCTRYVVADDPKQPAPPASNEDYPSYPQAVIASSMMPNTSTCRAQTDTQAYRDFVSNELSWNNYVVSPSMLAREGRACGNSSEATGTSCTPSGPVCKRYIYRPSGDYAYVTQTIDLPMSECATGTATDDERTMFSNMGVVLAGDDTSPLACVAPTVYGANGNCRTTQTKNPDGSTSIDRRFDLTCAAIKGDNAVEADDAYCINQKPTDAQKALLKSLNPNFYDYNDIDTSCTTSVGLNLKYQRRSQPSSVVEKPDTEFVFEGVTYLQLDKTSTYDYVCTDEADNSTNDSYFTGPMAGTADTYPVTRFPCNIQHTMDKEQARVGSYSYHGTCNEWDPDSTANGEFVHNYELAKWKPYCGAVVDDNDDGVMRIRSLDVIRKPNFDF